MKKLLIFAGTTEGRLLAQAMAQSQEEFREAERKGKALEAARRG